MSTVDGSEGPLILLSRMLFLAFLVSLLTGFAVANKDGSLHGKEKFEEVAKSGSPVSDKVTSHQYQTM